MTRDGRYPGGGPMVGVFIVLVALGGCIGTLSGGDAASLTFTEVSGDVGLEYATSDAPSDVSAGAFVADYDRDGDPDVLLTGGTAPTLLENTGDGFSPVSLFPAFDQRINSALFIDYDNDGWEDLVLIPRIGSPIGLENNRGTFRRTELGFNTSLSLGVGAAAGDYNGDGCLDLFIIQSGNWNERVPVRAIRNVTEPDNGNPNLLFQGTCGSFELASETGITGARWTMAASFADMTGDGQPDIHVANDFNHDYIYVNAGDGTFEPHQLPKSNRHGMASTAADIDDDGIIEVFVTNIEFSDPERVWELHNGLEVTHRGNNLFDYHDGRFVDRATEYGIRQGDWGWAGALEDFDNDGDLDLLHTTKDYLRLNDAMSSDPVHTRPAVWEHTADGFVRRNASNLGFEHSNGRGVTVLDYDTDGDLDIVIADINGEFKLYQNIGARDGGFVVVVGTGPNTPALGTVIRVTTSAGETYNRTVTSGGGFLSQKPRAVHFGLRIDEVATMEVSWPDGTVVVVEEVPETPRLFVAYDGETASPAVR